MEGFYTVCRFTEAHGPSYSRKYRYPKAPHAFVFHRDDGLNVKEILKPLFRLAKLHKPSKQALVLRVDEGTLVATFSLRGFPHPTKYKIWNEPDVVYPVSEDDLTGWFIRNVSSLAIDPVPVNIGEIYDTCFHITRHADQCPCDLLRTGQCFTDVVKPHLPPEFDANVMQIDHGELPSKVFKTVEYENIYGFKYVSPGLTTDRDFVKAHRAWNEIDFSCVEERKEKLSSRGKDRKKNNAFRKAHCSRCVFRTDDYSGDRLITKDCGEIWACKEHTSVTTAHAALAKYYTNSGFENMQGFTANERDYLISRSNEELKIRGIFSEKRKTAVKFGFFQQNLTTEQWAFSIVAAAGYLTRDKLYFSYADLREDIPELPTKPKAAKLSYLAKLACVGFGKNTVSYGGWGTSFQRYNVVVRGLYVASELCSTRYLARTHYLTFNEDLDRWIYRTLGRSYRDIPQYVRTG